MSVNNASEKQSLKGFAKGWTIFLIVYVSAFAVSLFQYLQYSQVAGIIMLILIFAAGMIVGLAFMLKKRTYGFWILLASSLLITLMSGTASGNITVISSGGLVLVLLTFLFTRKQLFAKKQNNGSQINSPTPSLQNGNAPNETVVLDNPALDIPKAVPIKKEG